jgi:Tol biopolymer transport system component
LADPAYKNVTQLTTGEAGYFEATFSPDGNTIAYSAGAGKLFFIPTAGGTPTQIPLTNLFGEEPIFTPNGQSLIFAGRPATGEGPMSAIYIVNLDGSGLTQLSAGGNDQHPAISSDGTLVAFERQGYNGTAYVENIAVVGIGGEGTANPATILTTDNFSWQPMFMGSELLFISSKDNPFSGNDNIYQMNYDGSDVVRLTDTPLENCFEWGTPNNPRNR